MASTAASRLCRKRARSCFEKGRWVVVVLPAPRRLVIRLRVAALAADRALGERLASSAPFEAPDDSIGFACSAHGIALFEAEFEHKEP